MQYFSTCRYCIQVNNFSRFGQNGTHLTMDEYDLEFNRLANFIEDERNRSIASIGSYKIDNSTIKGKLNNKLSHFYFYSTSKLRNYPIKICL